MTKNLATQFKYDSVSGYNKSAQSSAIMMNSMLNIFTMKTWNESLNKNNFLQLDIIKIRFRADAKLSKL